MGAIEKAIGMLLVVFTIIFFFLFFGSIITAFNTDPGSAFENLTTSFKPVVNTGGPIVIFVFMIGLLMSGIYLILKD